jgi:hypothetical protein
MAKTVVAFIGENENEILKAFSKELLVAMEPLGIEGHIIDACAAGWIDQFGRLARDGILFGFGFAGVGGFLNHIDPVTQANVNMWDTLRVPFISLLADQPAALPSNHRIPARYIVNGYFYRDFFEVQRSFIRSPQISVMLPQYCVPNPHRDAKPWGKREQRMVFVKSGGDPALRRANWRDYPVRIRAILEEASAEILTRSTGDINGVVRDCFASHGIAVGDRHDIFFAAVQQIDAYVRHFRGTQMAQALCRVPATIIGARWEHVDTSGAKARFLPAIKGDALTELYADTQFLVNVTPNFSSGTHERVLQGMAAKACVISDDNDFSRPRLAALPSYHGFDWTDVDWPDKIVAWFDSRENYEDRLQPAVDFVDAEFETSKLTTALIEIADLVRYGEQLTTFTYRNSHDVGPR